MGWQLLLRRAALCALSGRRMVAMALFSAGLHCAPVLAQLNCSTVYAINPTGQIYSVSTGGVQTLVETLPGSVGTVNGFGIAPGGTVLYIVTSGNTQGTSGRVTTYNTATDTVVGTSAAPTLPSNAGGILTGAVNPVTGWFYFSMAGAPDASATTWHLFAFNTASPTSTPVRVGVISGTRGNNGDIAFDRYGNLYLVSGNVDLSAPKNQMLRVGQVPTTAGTGTLPATVVAEVAVSGNVGGIAFNAAGELFTSSAGAINRYNPASGAQIGSSVAPSQGAISDLASCSYGNTIRLQKDLPHGRYAALNQFMLSLSGGGLSSARQATTTGNTSGVQPQTAGPVLAIDGATFTINETASGGTTLTHYGRSWQCVDEANANAVVASDTTFPGTVTMPISGSATGADLLCTITNAKQSQFRLAKTWAAGSIAGNRVVIGATTGLDSNTAAFNSTASTNTTGTAVAAKAGETATLPAETFSIGSATSYTTTLACDNSVTPSGTNGQASNTVTIPSTLAANTTITCTYTNTPRLATLGLAKTAGSAALAAGSVVTYTLTVTNAAGNPPVAGAVLRDTQGAGLNCLEAGLPAPACTVASGAAVCPTTGLTAAALVAPGSGVTLPDLPAGSGLAITLQCRVTASGT